MHDWLWIGAGCIVAFSLLFLLAEDTIPPPTPDPWL